MEGKQFFEEIKNFHWMLLLFIFMPFCGYAQDTIPQKEKSVPFIEFSAQHGNFVFKNNFTKGNNKLKMPLENYDALNLRVGFQTRGNSLWELLNSHPYYGVGLYLPKLGDTQELGHPFAFYGFFGAPLKQWRRLSFDYEYDFGVSGGWKPYNQNTNPYNTSIGAHFAWYVGANLLLRYQLSDRLSCNGGYEYMHFSNGTVRVPNLGLNLASPFLTIRYSFGSVPFVSHAAAIQSPFKKSDSFYFSVEKGIHQLQRDTVYTRLKDYYIPKNFSIYCLAGGWQRMISSKWVYTLGAELYYDEAMNAVIVGNETKTMMMTYYAPVDKRLTVDLFAGGEMLINHFALIGQVGYAVWSRYDPAKDTRLFQRIGMKYYLGNHFFIGTQLKMYHVVKATTMTWMAGFRFH